MRRRRFLSAASIPLLAGCLRVTGRDSGEPTNSTIPSQATTQSSDRADTTRGNVDYPTGLTSEGVDAFLADSHTNELARRSFSTEWVEANITRGEVTQKRSYRVGDGYAKGEWIGQGPITMFLSGEGGFWREELGNTVTYGQHREGFSIGRLTQNQMLRSLFQAGEWNEPVIVEGNESPEFQIEASTTDNTDSLGQEFEAESFESFTSQGTISNEGIVEKLQSELEYHHQISNRLYQFRHRYSVSSVGQVSVTTPEWLSTAKSRAPKVTARITDDQQFVEMQFKSGNPILTQTDLVLYDQDARTNAGYTELQEPMESRRTYYLYLSDGEMQISEGSRATDASTESLTGSYGLWAHRNGAEYFMIPRV